MATIFLAAFVPFALKVTAAGGVPVVAHVYVKADSPAVWSAPSTESVVEVVVTGEALEAAALTTVGFAKARTSDALSARL